MPMDRARPGPASAEGRRRWSRASKNSRNVRLISSEVTGTQCRPEAGPHHRQSSPVRADLTTPASRCAERSAGDRPPPHDQLAVHQTRQLPGRSALDRIRQLHRQACGGARAADLPAPARPAAGTDSEASRGPPGRRGDAARRRGRRRGRWRARRAVPRSRGRCRRPCPARTAAGRHAPRAPGAARR